jgi:hypothetical protein
MSAKTIEEAVTERLGKLGPAVLDASIEVLIEKELDKRKTQVVSAFTEYDELQKRLRRLEKGDLIAYNGDGSIKEASFSKGRLDELKKVRDRMAKIEAALEQGISASDFKKLNDLGGPLKLDNKGNSGNNSEGSEEENS